MWYLVCGFWWCCWGSVVICCLFRIGLFFWFVVMWCWVCMVLWWIWICLFWIGVCLCLVCFVGWCGSIVGNGWGFLVLLSLLDWDRFYWFVRLVGIVIGLCFCWRLWFVFWLCVGFVVLWLFCVLRWNCLVVVCLVVVLCVWFFCCCGLFWWYGLGCVVVFFWCCCCLWCGLVCGWLDWCWIVLLGGFLVWLLVWFGFVVVCWFWCFCLLWWWI